MIHLFTVLLKSFKKDTSIYPLLLVNLITIFVAITQNWNIITVVWLYGIQSLIIVFFNFVRTVSLKDFPNDQDFANNMWAHFFKTKWSIALYSFFFYVSLHSYLLILLDKDLLIIRNEITHQEVRSILFLSVLFFLNHLFSYFYNLNIDLERSNLNNVAGTLRRILPLHFVIILIIPLFGLLSPTFINTAFIVFFQILKTFVDLLMHSDAHYHEEKISTSLNKKIEKRNFKGGE